MKTFDDYLKEELKKDVAPDYNATWYDMTLALIVMNDKQEAKIQELEEKLAFVMENGVVAKVEELNIADGVGKVTKREETLKKLFDSKKA